MRLIQLATVVLTMALGSALHADSAHDEELDPSMLRIETGQYSALLGRASEAADIVFANDKHGADVDDECGSGVKSAALELLALRNKLADKKHMLKARLPAEAGALILKVLDLAMPETSSPEVPDPRTRTDGFIPSHSIDRPSMSHKRADALAVVFESFLAHGAEAMSGGDRHQIVVHVSAETLKAGGGCCEIEDGPALPRRQCGAWPAMPASSRSSRTRRANH